jgi:hypothetical protein
MAVTKVLYFTSTDILFSSVAVNGWCVTAFDPAYRMRKAEEGGGLASGRFHGC